MSTLPTSSWSLLVDSILKQFIFPTGSFEGLQQWIGIWCEEGRKINAYIGGRVKEPCSLLGTLWEGTPSSELQPRPILPAPTLGVKVLANPYPSSNWPVLAMNALLSFFDTFWNRSWLQNTLWNQATAGIWLNIAPCWVSSPSPSCSFPSLTFLSPVLALFH